MLSRGQKMKSSCPRGGFRTWSSIGGVRIFNGLAQLLTDLPISPSRSLSTEIQTPVRVPQWRQRQAPSLSR